MKHKSIYLKGILVGRKMGNNDKRPHPALSSWSRNSLFPLLIFDTIINANLSLEFLAMLTGWLADRFPHRNIVVAGAVIATVGFVISSFATNIYLVMFGYGVLAGRCYKIHKRLLINFFLNRNRTSTKLYVRF